MATGQKRSRPARIRHRIETDCKTEAEKEALSRRLDSIRQLLTPEGSRSIDNSTLLNAMFDIVEREIGQGLSTPSAATVRQSMMKNSGKKL